ncbi:MAG: hypothetical protein SGI72_02945 [Planctomycetota bacterium]|nr:hypothetical protein [Planctomycetota bacterium]
MNFADAYDPIRALTSAWKLIGRSPAPLIFGGALLTLLGVGPWLSLRMTDIHPANVVAFVLGLGLCCGLFEFLLRSWLSLGLANATRKTLVEGSARFDDLFVSNGRFFDMVLVRILLFAIGVATILPVVLLVLLGGLGAQAAGVNDEVIALAAVMTILVWVPIAVYVVLGFGLATEAVAIEGLNPTQALKRSWQIARSNRLRLFVYLLALWMYKFLGLCACCIGILFTGAQAQVAMNESYLQLVKPAEPLAPPAMPAA